MLALLAVLIMLSGPIQAATNKFKIDFLSVNRSVAYLGEEVTISYTIKTAAKQPAHAVYLHFFLDEDKVGKQEIRQFDNNGRAQGEYSFKAQPQGRFNLRAVLSGDPQGKNVYSSEQRQLAILSLPGGVTNEKQTTAMQEEAGAAPANQEKLPDLTPAKLAFDKPSPQQGDEVNILTTISNSGSADADAVRLRVFADGLPVGKDAIVNIPAGGKVMVKTSFTPKREGKKDILVMVNPDSTTKELSGRNNIISKPLVVRPAPKVASAPVAAKVEEKKKAKKTRPKTKKPVVGPVRAPANLVAFIETIGGIHYTRDGRIHLFISNNSNSDISRPITVGIRNVTGKPNWLVRGKILHLAAGETRRLEINWPNSLPNDDQVYVAVADINDKIAETDDHDNQTRPFRVVRVGKAQPAANPATPAPVVKPAASSVKVPAGEILILQPRDNEVVSSDGQLNIRWKTADKAASSIKLAILDTRTGRMMLSTETRDNGIYHADISSFPAAEYTLLVSSSNGRSKAKKTRFRIQHSGNVAQIDLSSPLAGGSWRSGQVMSIKWTATATDLKDQYLNFYLIETTTGLKQKINFNAVAASLGMFSWKIPDDGTVFGLYSLLVTSADGTQIAKVNELEFLPSFVPPDAVEQDSTKPNTIHVDMSIKAAGFEGPYYRFIVRNNGPYELSAGLTAGFSFNTYFIRHVPIRTSKDLVVCNNNLIARMPVNTEQTLWPGKDPDCPVGTRDPDEKFVYAVTRLSPPDMIDVRFTGDNRRNNMVKFYWTDQED